jgi:hypothetical protein
MDGHVEALRADLEGKPSRAERIHQLFIWTAGVATIFALGVLFGAQVVAR